MNRTNHSHMNPTVRRRNLIALCGASALALGCALLPGIIDSRASGTPLQAATNAAALGDHQATTMRIGTYDSRAVAVAYVRSDLSARKLNELLRQRSEAEKKGDQKRVDELNALGESMQVRKNLQGFSTAPVDDVLDVVRDKLPALAQRQNVAVITREADYRNASVETVDITDELVQLFNPDKKTLQVINDLRKQKPIAIEEAARIPARN